MFQIVIFLLYRALCYLKFLTNIYCSYNHKKKNGLSILGVEGK